MERFLGPPTKKRKLQYNRDNLRRAFEATVKGVSVYRAAREYSVPESTLRDRHLGLVSLDTHIGFDTIFSKDEEQKLVSHVSYMADIGYGYNKSAIQHMAWDYAKSLGKEVKAKESLSDNWFYGLLKRWPDLCVKKPQKLSVARAKSASREALDSYYCELESILTANDLHDKPQCIFNIDETGVNSEHTPPKIVCDKSTIPQNITSTRSQTITIIAAGNAIGNSIPPYYVFPGQRWNPEFLSDACPGSAGEMSKTGWSNTGIFENYLKNHFSTYVHLAGDTSKPKTLILYDGHRSHTSLTLTDWAKKNNVILFVLPPHSSHLTQPLDVGVFGPFKSMYYSECQQYMKRNPGMNITKYQIASLTSRPYLKAVSAENLQSAFRRTGIYPFDKQAILESQIAPSTIYAKSNQPTQEESQSENSQQKLNPEPEPAHNEGNFFQSRTITKVVSKPKRKFVPPFLTGNLHKESVQDVLKAQATKSETVKRVTTSESSATKTLKVVPVPRPSTSGKSKSGGPIPLLSEDSASDSEVESEISEEDKCCVCHKWEPDLTAGSAYITIVNWGKCDICGHWTHLKTCSSVRVLRRNDEFKCPHCEKK